MQMINKKPGDDAEESNFEDAHPEQGRESEDEKVH